MAAIGVGAVLLVAAVVGGAMLWEQRDQAGSRPGQVGAPGIPLQAPSGLRLLVANGSTVFVLDVDAGAVQPVTGLPTGADRSTHVESVGQDAVVISRRDCQGCDADSVAYLVRHGQTVASRLGPALDVESSEDGRGVWFLGRQDATHCTLGQVGLDGRPRRPGRPMPCDAARSGAEQTLDVWLLDLTTRRWRQLPDMPLRLGPSKPQLRWTSDGRLLLLAEHAEVRAGLVAVWRPGQPRVAVRQVNLPGSRTDGGLRFVIW